MKILKRVRQGTRADELVGCQPAKCECHCFFVDILGLDANLATSFNRQRCTRKITFPRSHICTRS